MNPYQKIVQDIRDLRELDPKDAHALVLKALESVEREPAKHHHAARRAVRAAMKRAGFSSHMSYAVSLEQVQAEFVGAAGETLYTYVKTLHGRIGGQDSFSSIHGFGDWDYGSPGMKGGKWSIRVWAKSGGGSGWDQHKVSPNLSLVLDFANGVSVSLLMDNHQSIFSKKIEATQASASSVGMACGEAWEKLLTGSVDYGD